MASSVLLQCGLTAPLQPASFSPPRRPLLLLPRLPAFRLQPLLHHRLAAPRSSSSSADDATAVDASSSQAEDVPFDISRLEQYTEKVQSEVLRVKAVVDGEEDQVLIYKGFSSSLMRATAFDPAEPVLPPSATIQAIDRIRGPYNPAKVLLIKGGRGLSWQQFQAFLEEKGM